MKKHIFFNVIIGFCGWALSVVIIAFGIHQYQVNEKKDIPLKNGNLTYEETYRIYYEADASDFWNSKCSNGNEKKIDVLLQHTNGRVLDYFLKNNGRVVLTKRFQKSEKYDSILGEYMDNQYVNPYIYLYLPKNDHFIAGIDTDVLNHELLHHLYQQFDFSNDEDLIAMWKLSKVNNPQNEYCYENMNEFFAYRFSDFIDSTKEYYDSDWNDYAECDLGDNFNDEDIRNQYVNYAHIVEKKIENCLEEE